ncbi:MAG: HpcH/HpaI aldolase/citrate lyase family protein [Gammaproteobacteria bacterium]|nr:HpcH/HpaI aldolase/citrate lyase family protein [Gammaproteobacteria bacterium]
MKVPSNPLKAALVDNRVQFGYWLALANPYSAEVCATAGFDWLMIDGEHAPNDIPSILAQLQAVAAYPSQPVVRPAEGTLANVKQLLDIGAHNLLIPMVETADQAREMVRATRYPPDGSRGVGAAIARSSRWLAIDNYDFDVHDQICLLLQIESRTGLENLDRILEIDGYDGIFIGPADLAASLDYLGNSRHPDVQSEISTAIAKIRQANKAAGILSTEDDMIQAYLDMGVVFIAVGVDTITLASAARALANQYRKTAPEQN